ncbi:MAG: 50S ribosomal protein L4 [Candidatus Aenigmatarchaeota archaeon]|nr:MAG: 50S ribosomal protein L4 [Candidatus Aenigmarchaeota archaeon]
MKVAVLSLSGEKKGEIEIPLGISEIRADLIRRAVLAEQSKKRQPYGTDTLAGKRTSAHYHGRRGIRWSMMNREMARMKRIHNQGFLNYAARFVPQAVKGRKAHPPKVEKVWEQKINKKERLKALMHAIVATFNKEMVLGRGHRIDELKYFPFALDNSFQKIKKTKDVVKLFCTLGLEKELERCKEKKVRAGKGKMRGRKYRVKKGPLVVIGKDEGVSNAVKNIAGVDVCKVDELTVEALAPGTCPGRLTIWTEDAIKMIGNINYSG